MISNTPLVAIALAAYCPEPTFLKLQLRSLIEQTHSHWICCITFDSPLSDLADEELKELLGDSRFRLKVNPVRLGLNKNFEAALKMCVSHRASYFAYCDQDDIWFSHKLSLQIQILEQDKNIGMCACNMLLIEDEKISQKTAWQIENLLPDRVQVDDFFIRNVCAGTASVFRSELVEKILPFPEVDFPFHDWWTALVVAQTSQIRFINEALYAYRQHAGNVLGATAFKGRFALNDSIREVGVFAQCKKSYRNTSLIYQAYLARFANGERLRERLKILGWDFGLLFFIQGFINWRLNPPISRNCLARGFGKLLHSIRWVGFKTPRQQPKLP